MLPCLYSGRPIVAAPRERFEPEWAAALIVRSRVRNVFLPPTALKLMRQAGVRVPVGALRTVMSGGEVLGEEMLAWGLEELGVTVNEIYGQTEANYVIERVVEEAARRRGAVFPQRAQVDASGRAPWAAL